jgi:hypothetical protein
MSADWPHRLISFLYSAGPDIVVRSLPWLIIFGAALLERHLFDKRDAAEREESE